MIAASFRHCGWWMHYSFLSPFIRRAAERAKFVSLFQWVYFCRIRGKTISIYSVENEFIYYYDLLVNYDFTIKIAISPAADQQHSEEDTTGEESAR
jgi:hypothetical protein